MAADQDGRPFLRHFCRRFSNPSAAAPHAAAPIGSAKHFARKGEAITERVCLWRGRRRPGSAVLASLTVGSIAEALFYGVACTAEGDRSMWRTTAAASFVLVSTVALADDKSKCVDSEDHDLRIKSCSALIERNAKDAVALHNRGEAYALKGEVDRAISDYTKAIVADPNYAPAYDRRGRAYVSKGDYVRAVDDVTRAGELTRKTLPRPAVVEAAPPKQKKDVKTELPAPGKSPIAATPSTLGKAPVAEKLPEADKAAIVETPAESPWLGGWPTWMPR
jgi:tetratricopeptide (TPR) repeat protein